MRRILFFYLSMLCMSLAYAQSPYYFFNITKEPVAVGQYYKDTFSRRFVRLEEPLIIGPNDFASIDQLPSKFGKTRFIVLGHELYNLTPQLLKSESLNLSYFSMSRQLGRYFFISESPKGLNLEYRSKWRMLQKENVVANGGKIGSWKKFISRFWLGDSEKVKESFEQSPYKNAVAHVRVVQELSFNEKKAIADRLMFVKKRFSHLIDDDVDVAPRVALLGSGGGYRAMSYTLGVLAGLEKEGLLDCLTWVVGLSGSSWAIGTWLAVQSYLKSQNEKTLSVSEFIHRFNGLISEKTIFPRTLEENRLLNISLQTELKADQPLTLVSVYSQFLANRLLSMLGPDRHRMYLSGFSNLLDEGKWPIPVFTAVMMPGEGMNKKPWIEFTPWEVGSSELGFYIPTWAFGRYFVNGTSKLFVPERSLGFLFGVYGSAFATTFRQYYQLYKGRLSPYFKSLVKKYVVTPYGEQLVTAAKVRNYMRGVQNSPYKKSTMLHMMDAALEFNIPYPVVSGQRPERKADVLIIVDSSESVAPQDNALLHVERYAQEHKFKMPQIDYEGIDTRAVSVFEDKEDPEVPAIIYIPCVHDLRARAGNPQLWTEYKRYLDTFDIKTCMKDGSCATFSLRYSAQALTKINKLGEFNVRVHKQQILDVLASHAQKRE